MHVFFSWPCKFACFLFQARPWNLNQYFSLSPGKSAYMVTPGWIKATSLMLLLLWRRHFWNFETRSDTIQNAAGQAIKLRHAYSLLSSDDHASLALSPRRQDAGEKVVLAPRWCSRWNACKASILFLNTFLPTAPMSSVYCSSLCLDTNSLAHMFSLFFFYNNHRVSLG
jgi:hypothetical protein